MSHFSVIVITNVKPDGDIIDGVMAPYMEFDGEDTRFLRDVDITEDTRSQYESGTERRLQAPDGSLHRLSEDQFYRDATPDELEKIGPLAGTGSGDGLSWHSRDWGDGLGYRTKVRFVPEGWAEVEAPRRDLMTFPEFIESWDEYQGIRQGEQPDYEGDHSRGYYVIDADGEVKKVFRRYNPDGHWDWYSIGGRWRGELRAINPGEALVGDDNTPKGTFDVCQRGNLDIEAMKKAGLEDRRRWIEEIAKKAEVDLEVLERMLHLEREIHPKWLALESRPRGDEYRKWLGEIHPEGDTLYRVGNAAFRLPELKEGQSLEDFIADVTPLTAHAVIKDGKWMHQGKMGFFASVRNETMSPDEWNATVWKMVEETPADHWITIIDCHV